MKKPDFYFGKDVKTPRQVSAALPVGVVLTIAAAGSEGSANSVVNLEPGNRKRAATGEALRPKFAILNPEFTMTLPPFQTVCGAVDIFAHLVERYFTPTRDVLVSDEMIEGLMRAVASAATRALANPTDYSARADLMWAGSLAHNNVCGVGRAQDWSSHGIEHELSALYDCAHGAGLAVVMPAWMDYAKGTDLSRFARFAARVWDVSQGVMREALAKSGLSARDIAAIGIANQRETTVVWNRHTGRPVYNAIVWQSRQSAEISEDLKRRGLGETFRRKTGLPIDAYFSGTKIAWILDQVPDARQAAVRGDLLFGTIDTWLVWKLTGGKVHATDYSNASRTLVYNIRDLAWDGELLSILGIPPSLLPDVRSTSGSFGETTADVLGASIPICGVAGDQQAALFGQGCFDKGSAKNTYGTGCFLLMNTGSAACDSANGLATTIAWGVDGRVDYALEGSVFVAGSAIQWLRDGLKVIDSSAESEAIAASVPDSAGVYVVPAFTGLGAPYWDESARGMVIGLTRGTTRAHIVRATLESLAYQTKDVIGALEADAGTRLSSLNVDGGAAANDLLMQFQADILGVSVNRAPMLETTALGAAFLAGHAAGVWSKDDLSSIRHQSGKSFTPTLSSERAVELYKGWRKAVRHARHWLEDE